MSKITTPKTIKDFTEIKRTILELMDNQYIDGAMYGSLTMKLKMVNNKIEELKRHYQIDKSVCPTCGSVRKH